MNNNVSPFQSLQRQPEQITIRGDSLNRLLVAIKDGVTKSQSYFK